MIGEFEMNFKVKTLDFEEKFVSCTIIPLKVDEVINSLENESTIILKTLGDELSEMKASIAGEVIANATIPVIEKNHKETIQLIRKSLSGKTLPTFKIIQDSKIILERLLQEESPPFRAKLGVSDKDLYIKAII